MKPIKGRQVANNSENIFWISKHIFFEYLAFFVLIFIACRSSYYSLQNKVIDHFMYLPFNIIIKYKLIKKYSLRHDNKTI